MFYLGQPYHDPDPAVRESRYRAGASIATALIREGFIIFAPIVHWHPVRAFESLPTDFDFWMRQDLSILIRCDLLIVYLLEGWNKSKGLAHEIAFAEANNIPLLYLKRFPDGDFTVQLEAHLRGTRQPVAGRT